MRRMKYGILLFVLLFSVLLSGCGRRFTIPKDWVYLSHEEALNYYKEVDFTVENVTEGFVTMEQSVKRYNEWDELRGETFNTVWGPNASNIILFDSKENTFLMDCSYTTCTQIVKLNPETFEVIEILDEDSFEMEVTLSEYPWSGFILSSYYVPYNMDGSVVLNDAGELIVKKQIMKDLKVERVKGHGEWMQNIPEEYMMNTMNYSAIQGWSEEAIFDFFVVEGQDAYFIYECFDERKDGLICRPQTTAYDLQGTDMWSTGASENFMDGFENPFND